MTRLPTTLGLLGLLVGAWAAPIGERTPASARQQQPPPAPPPAAQHHACAPGIACCPAAFQMQAYCRVGCPGPPPKKLLHVAPDLATVAKPYPSGVVILELAINEKGVVVSSCLLRGIRSDFDKAAQISALRWKFNPYLLKGKPVGVVMTVTVGTPDFDKDGRKREGGAEP